MTVCSRRPPACSLYGPLGCGLALSPAGDNLQSLWAPWLYALGGPQPAVYVGPLAAILGMRESPSGPP
eukprot:3233349-Lingulodinium_polyedra.AAC.1